MLTISVVTVCRNSAATIADTLESVARQTWPREHIVIDGASTDGTQAVIERYRMNLAQVVSERDAGIYDAMNKGIRLATGDVVGILNSDDVYADTEVLAQVAGIMHREQLDALYGDLEYFNPTRPGVPIRRYRSIRFSPARIAWGWMPAHPTLFLRRSVFERFGLYRTDFQIAGDYELVARIFKDEILRRRYLPEVMVRMRTGGISTGGWRNTYLLNQEVLRACRENGIRTGWFRLLSKYPVKLLEFLRQ